MQQLLFHDPTYEDVPSDILGRLDSPPCKGTQAQNDRQADHSMHSVLTSNKAPAFTGHGGHAQVLSRELSPDESVKMWHWRICRITT